MNLDWDDLKTVLALVRAGSLNRAADALGVSYTTVSRRIKVAEDRLGATLFERLADGYHPTADAELIARHAADMEKAELELMRKLQGRDSALTGSMTLTAPQLLIGSVLAPIISEFSKANPQVDIRVRATNELLDLNRREADLAIRISRNPGDTLKGLRLAEQDSASYATQDWANRIATDPNCEIDWIVYEAFDVLPDVVTDNFPGSRVTLRFDDMVAMQGAAASGLGVVRMPMFLGRNTPGLVQVPCLPPTPYPEIWVVAHPDVWPSAKLTAFRTMLVAHFRKIRASFVA